MYTAQPGDILLYRKIGLDFVPELAIDLGERLEDGPQPHEYYHVAIALNASQKIECNGSDVQVLDIDYGKFDAFRPPIPEANVDHGLQAVLELEGQGYDWPLILDEGLRDISNGRLHLDESYINGQEETHKVCSTLAAYYFAQARWGEVNAWPKPSPEDVWLQVKEYPVSPQGGPA